jgi:hypothetical protein
LGAEIRFVAPYSPDDPRNLVLCGAGHNIRRLLKKLRLLFTFIVWAITGDSVMNHGAHQRAVG